MNKILSLFFVLLVTICLTSCSSNKNIKGLGDGIYIGNELAVLQDKYKEGDIREDYIEIKNVDLFDNRYIGNYMIMANEEGKVDKIIVSFANGVNCEELISTLSEFYKEPVHRDNYKDKRQDYCNLIWHINKETFLRAIISNDTEMIYETVIQQRDLNSEKIAVDKYNNIIKVTSEDNDLNDFYNFILSRSDSIEKPIQEAINNFDAKYSQTTFSNNLEFVDTQRFFDIDFTTIYSVENQYAKSYYLSDFNGQISSACISFPSNDNTVRTVIDKLTSLFGQPLEQYNDDNKYIKYTWNLLPIRMNLTVYDNHTSNAIMDIGNNISYDEINPEFGSVQNLEFIAPYKDVPDEILYGKTGYYGYVNTNSRKGEMIKDVIEQFVFNCLKYPDGATVYGMEIKKITKNDYVVKGKFKAQNAFGVFSVDDFNIYVSDESGYPEISNGTIAGQIIG